MKLWSVSKDLMDVCAGQRMQAVSSCPSSASRKESGCTVLPALLDTILMVSIFVFLILPGLIWAIVLSILAGIIFLVIRLGPAHETSVPKEQALSAA